MNEEEKKEYLKLTVFQKDIVDTIKELGFKHKYFSVYAKTGFGEINVAKFSKWSAVLLHIYNEGAQQKLFEIKNILQL